MIRLILWFRKEPKTILACLLLVCNILTLHLLWSATVSKIVVLIWKYTVGVPTQTLETADEFIAFIKESHLHAIYRLFEVIVQEELTSRIVPLSVAVLLAGYLSSCRSRIYLITATVLLSSTCFGWGHGGVMHIFIQGVGGVLYCTLFLKCGGLRGAIIKPSFLCILTHFMFDALAFTVILTQEALHS